MGKISVRSSEEYFVAEMFNKKNIYLLLEF